MHRIYFDRFLSMVAVGVIAGCLALTASLSRVQQSSVTFLAAPEVEVATDRSIVPLLDDRLIGSHLAVDPLVITLAPSLTSMQAREEDKAAVEAIAPKTPVVNDEKDTPALQANVPAISEQRMTLLAPPLLSGGPAFQESSTPALENALSLLLQSPISLPTATTGVPDAASEEVETSSKASHVSVQAPVKEPIIGTANRIEVPSISIDLPVFTGAYDTATGSWAVDDSSAFHADTTVPVNDSNGTTLIYGHAKWGVFGNLPDAQLGAEATVHTAEGRRFIYVLELVKKVDPGDVSMLNVESEPTLILQTCSGLLDQHRTLAVFRLKEIL